MAVPDFSLESRRFIDDQPVEGFAEQGRRMVRRLRADFGQPAGQVAHDDAAVAAIKLDDAERKASLAFSATVRNIAAVLGDVGILEKIKNAKRSPGGSTPPKAMTD